MQKAARALVRWGRFLPIFVVCQSLGCLPDNALRSVLAENITRTFSIVIQSFVAIVFGNVFPFA